MAVAPCLSLWPLFWGLLYDKGAGTFRLLRSDRVVVRLFYSVRRAWAPMVGKILLTAPFWWSGLSKLADFKAAAAETRAFGLCPPALAAAAVIIVQLGGSALIIAGRGVGAGSAGSGGLHLGRELYGARLLAATRRPRTHGTPERLSGQYRLIGGLALAAALAESAFA